MGLLSGACTSKGGVKDIYLAADKAGTKRSNVFNAFSDIVCIVKLKDVPADTQVTVDWVSVDAPGFPPNRMIRGETSPFVIDKMSFPMPVEELTLTPGNYQAVVYLDDTRVRTLDFKVEIPSNDGANDPNLTGPQAAPAGFQESDCALQGMTFDNITIDYIVDDMYDGAYLICSGVTTGSHGQDENNFLKITAYKPALLQQYYDELKANNQRSLDQANEWNANPDIPEEMKDTISIIRDDDERFMFLITQEANVPGCLMGDGFGAEMFYEKYLI
jgi:hypothetical protein